MSAYAIKESKRRLKFGAAQDVLAPSFWQADSCVVALRDPADIFRSMARRVPGLTGPPRELESGQLVTTLRVFAAQIGLILIVGGMFAGTLQARDIQVPWAAVAEVLQSQRACDEDRRAMETEPRWVFARAAESEGRAPDYAVKPRQAMTVEPSQGTRISDGGRTRRVGLFRWQDAVWRPGSHTTLRMRDRQPLLLDGIADAGFYKAGVPGVTPPLCHAIVCENWKKDLLAFCRHSKQRIELNPDAELIRSSLAVSHWDHVMGLASESRALTGGILGAAIGCAQTRYSPNFLLCWGLGESVGSGNPRLKQARLLNGSASILGRGSVISYLSLSTRRVRRPLQP